LASVTGADAAIQSLARRAQITFRKAEVAPAPAPAPAAPQVRLIKTGEPELPLDFDLSGRPRSQERLDGTASGFVAQAEGRA